MKKKISLIIPCYNEEESLPYFYKETKSVLGTIPDYDAEFLFVNDGSKDRTLSVLKENLRSLLGQILVGPI